MLKDFYHLKRENNPRREDAFTLSCLGKIHPASSSDFVKFRRYLSDLLDESISSNDNIFCENRRVLIIGLTESGIIPALLMYIETIEKNINASILYSTRRPQLGIPFKESHSHGPNHTLPLPILPLTHTNLLSYSDNVSNKNFEFKEIWIVEDEITSGNTVHNLMVKVCQYLKVRRVRVFAFADFRSNQQKSDFSLKITSNNINCTVHTLNTTYNNNLNQIDFFTDKKSVIEALEINNSKLLMKNIIQINNISKEQNTNLNNISEIELLKSWHLPEKRPALNMKSGNFINNVNSDLLNIFSNKFSVQWRESKILPIILAVGEAVDLAACLAFTDENIKFQQISLSPWKVDKRFIFSKLAFADKYYLYNYENLKDSKFNKVFILCDPIDRDIEKEAIKKLGECGVDVKSIF